MIAHQTIVNSAAFFHFYLCLCFVLLLVCLVVPAANMLLKCSGDSKFILQRFQDIQNLCKFPLLNLFFLFSVERCWVLRTYLSAVLSALGKEKLACPEFNPKAHLLFPITFVPFCSSLSTPLYRDLSKSVDEGSSLCVFVFCVYFFQFQAFGDGHHCSQLFNVFKYLF